MKTLKSKLLLALVVMWIGLLVLAAWSALNTRQNMINEREAGLKRVVETAEGTYTFDTVYPALGSDPHVLLAQAVGAALGEKGCITVDRHQRTNIPGVYAAGDVVIGLDQISHAMGEGGVAATTIRNDLAARTPLLR